MSDDLDHRLDERLRTALHDLDRRIDQRLAARTEPSRESGTERGTDLRGQAGRRGRIHRRGPRLVPALTGFAVIALLVTIGWLARPSESTPPAVSPPTPAVTAPPTPAVTTSAPDTGGDPSQSTADAARDGVNPTLARVSVSRRVQPSDPLYSGATTRISAPEGTWLISRPDKATLGLSDSACLARTQSYGFCYEYTEILLMSADLKRIIRAYPIPELPAQWLVLTPDAIYCGRQGDGGIPDSMVCRIDRSTHAFTGRVFPHSGLADPPDQHTFEGWPGTWSNNQATKKTGFDQATIDPTTGVLRILDFRGKSTITLDPVTLKPSR